MILIATPTEAYHNEKGLNLVQKHIAQLGGAFEVETYEEKGKERRRLRITADATERTRKGKDGKDIPPRSVAGDIRWYLESQYLWKVEEATE